MSALGVWSVFFAAYLAYVGFAEEPSWLNWAALIYFPPWFLACLAAEAKSSRETYQPYESWLRRPYRTLVDGVLAGLPKLLTPATAENPPTREGQSRWRYLLEYAEYWTDLRASSQDDLKRLRENPWSWPVFDAALKIAVAYPLFFALVSWAFGGEAVLGSLLLMGDESPTWLRYATVGVLVTLLTARLMATATSQSFFEHLATWLLPIVGAIAVVVSVAFAAAGASAIAVAAAAAGAYAGALAVAVVVAVAVAVAGAGVGGFVVGAAAAVAITTALSRKVAAGHVMLSFSIFWLGCLSVALATATVSAIDSPGLAFIIGLALLPLLNAPLDYLSYGLTISLLKRGKNKLLRHLLNGFLDVAAAGALFFLLSCTLMAVFAGLSYVRGDELFDVTKILLQVRDTPGEAGWIIAMVASTLLPTAIHLLIVVVSLSTLFSPRAYRALLAAMDDDNKGPPVLPTIGMALGLGVWALVPAAALYGLGWLAMEYAEVVRLAYVSALEWVGLTFGMLDAPLPPAGPAT